MNNSFLFRIGVIIYALCIGYFGVNGLMDASDMAGYHLVPDYMPGAAKIWIYMTSTCLVLAAISFLIGKYTRIAALLLTAFLVIVILTVQIPHVQNGNLTDLIKDSAMAGGALMIAGKG